MTLFYLIAEADLMSRNKRPSLIRQAHVTLQEKTAFGESRHRAKASGTARKKIFSYGTYHTYMPVAVRFTRYCKENHGCRYLEECLPYTREYFDSRAHLSAWTLAKDRSALAKLFGRPGPELGPVPSKKRADIRRCRSISKRFSEKRNQDIVNFARGTGLRRHELTVVRGEQLRQREDGNWYLEGIHGKGGRIRDIQVLPEYAEDVIRMCSGKGEHRVFDRVPSAMPVHRYRAEYAYQMYLQYARDLSTVPRNEIYYCRDDMAGIWLDKKAMKIVSLSLGHNRISVMAQSYLYQLNPIFSRLCLDPEDHAPPDP